MQRIKPQMDKLHNKFTSHKWQICYIIVSFIVLLSYAIRCGHAIYISRAVPWNGYGISEFLISYQGGFVRRGFLGELVFRFCRLSGVSPITIIYTICLTAYLFVLIFFIKKFANFKLNWWLIFTPFLCAYMTDIIRKDFLSYSLIIFIFYIIRKENLNFVKCLYATLICIVGIFIHEAFIFYGFPLMALFILKSDCGRRKYWLLAIVPVVFLLFCYFKGDKVIVEKIIGSWNNLLGNDILVNSKSIAALGWDTKNTFIMHFKANFTSSFFGMFGWVWRIIMFMLIYYFITNFLYVFKGKSKFNKTDRDIISTLFIISVICLLPMFIFLSCDYGRIYQYAFMSTFITYLLVKNNMILKVVGKTIIKKLSGYNDKMNNILKPKKWILLVLLLFLSEAPYDLSLRLQFNNSIVGFIEAKTERIIEWYNSNQT